MGLIYAAALAAIRARRGHAGAMLATALLAAAAFYTRLNNLPMVCALLVFALPTRQPLATIWRPSTWLRRASRPVVVTVIAAVAAAMLFFAWRTWHYTGHFSLFYGTQAAERAVWKPEHSFLEGLSHVMGSMMMVLTMTDPPAFDVRALPIVGGMLAALGGLLGIGRLRTLPLNASVLALAGLSGSLVARGSAYPGRFSLHLIPAAVAIFMCAGALVVTALRTRSARRARRSPDTTSGPANQFPTPESPAD